MSIFWQQNKISTYRDSLIARLYCKQIIKLIIFMTPSRACWVLPVMQTAVLLMFPFFLKSSFFLFPLLRFEALCQHSFFTVFFCHIPLGVVHKLRLQNLAFVTTYPTPFTFSMVWKFTKSHYFWLPTPLHLHVNVVCERPPIISD